MRSRDFVFIKDQTTDGIDKTEKEDSPDSGDLTDVNLQDIGDFDAPIDDVVADQQQTPIAPPAVPFRRSSRDRRYSVRYSSDDYVLLTDEGEPECYEEAMKTRHGRSAPLVAWTFQEPLLEIVVALLKVMQDAV
ncbi:hypothetical protein V6N11_042710 [Hibiscus sabdariffa]|uniref:Uncharacterized protein n=1 Tax=Hibiscus sabdariffa TaxID=183260 RepID=A0ABR2QX55_9ROSI